MGGISDAQLLSTLRHQMTVSVAKQVTAAGNLANLDTPGYRAREVDFAATLDEQLASAGVITTTNAQHMQAPGGAAMHTVESEDLPARRDGNTVQMDRELLTMTKASGEFSAAQTALAAKFRMIRYALAEGR